MVRSHGRCIAHALTANNERQALRRSATGEGHAATRNTGARGTSNRTGNHPAQSQIWTTGRRLRNTVFVIGRGGRRTYFAKSGPLTALVAAIVLGALLVITLVIVLGVFLIAILVVVATLILSGVLRGYLRTRWRSRPY